MSKPGDLWELPGGHRALEVSGSTRDTLRVAIIRPRWPFPSPAQEVPRNLCKRLQHRDPRVSAPADCEEAPF